MSSDTPAGNPERAPAALIVEGDSLATLRRIGAALPALREAAGRYAVITEDAVKNGDWDLVRDGLATMPEESPTRARVATALPYGDALALAEVCKATLRAEADAADRAAVERVALAVARIHSPRHDGHIALPERGEAEIEIEEALNPPKRSHDWQRDAAERRARISEARGDSEAAAPWICLYGIERRDGGPEEGGWSYDWLTPLACWNTGLYSDPRDARGAARAYAREQGLILATDEGARPVYSVSSHNRVNAIILPAAFPFADASIERPRYE